MNSVVPIANPPMARASSARVKLIVRVSAVAGVVVVMLLPVCGHRAGS